MNGPPGNEEAARMLETSEAAEDRNAAQSLDDDGDERKRLQGLQARAEAAGFRLVQNSHGYMLLRGIHSWHSTSLETIAHVLKAQRPARGT